MWESRAFRLLTIFFCGPTIVTPTFFRSLVCEIEGEGRRERRERDTIRHRGRRGGRKWKAYVRDGECDTNVTFYDMLPALLPSLSSAPVIHKELHFPEGYADSCYYDPVSGRNYGMPGPQWQKDLVSCIALNWISLTQ